ncbi:hypothetical protein KAR91_12005 [Candidatus Pacearchaeota archaeon]|nr:hypothetical protein [Candidatus Pacearchaeota archaeon]
MSAAIDLEDQLQRDIATFVRDPLGFVLYAYPWQEKGTPLEDETGPDKWQEQVLKDIGHALTHGWVENNGNRVEIINGRIWISVRSGHGIGKILSNINNIDTPEGLKPWGDINEGDVVFGADGRPTKVTNKYPHKDWDFYRIAFSDGTCTYAGLEHQWNVTTNCDRRDNKPPRTVTTEDMVGSLNRGYQLPLTKPVEYDKSDPLLDPYVLGYILGNGSSRTSSAIKISCFDEEVYEFINNSLPDDHCLKGSENYKHISRVTNSNKPNIVVGALRTLGLKGVLSVDKFVPDSYKYNSSEIRINLLRGLMDSDGTISPRKGDQDRKGYKVQFSTSSKKLRDDVVWIVRSLGGVANFSTDRRRNNGELSGAGFYATSDNYEVHINLPNSINPFRLPRKADLYEDYVNTVKREPIKVVRSIEYDHTGEGHCITVEAVDSLYLANDFIVTHNSALMAWLDHWFISTHPDPQCVTTANTDTQLRTKTWRENAKWKELLINAHWFTWTATRLIFKERPNTWHTQATPWSKQNTQAFAGTHEKYLMMKFDEASEIYDGIWEVTEGAMTEPNGIKIWIVFGNPSQPTGRFFECFGKRKAFWITYEIDARESKRTDKELIAEQIKFYGIDHDFVKVRILGKPPASGTKQFIGHGLIDGASGKVVHISSYADRTKILGVDIARFGDDQTVFIKRQGPVMYGLQKFRDLNAPTVAGRIAETIKAWDPDQVFLDMGNIGAAIYDILVDWGYKDVVTGVWFGSSADDNQTYFNKRIEMVGRYKEWLENGGAIPDDNELRDDSTGPEYFFNSQERFQLERADDMKSRGLASPDCLMAAGLTFAYPVEKRTKHSKKTGRAKVNYDMFAK